MARAAAGEGAARTEVAAGLAVPEAAAFLGVSVRTLRPRLYGSAVESRWE
jgi:hypothetical protein